MSEFQEQLHNEGYEKVLIIGVGKDFLQDLFGENFTENSILPLVLDTSDDFINFVLREQFDAASHKELIILGTDGLILDRIVMDFDSIEPYVEQIHEIIVQNYPSIMLGDINNDGFLNILDIVLIVNLILSDENHENADLNEDGITNILDIVQLVNIIIGG